MFPNGRRMWVTRVMKQTQCIPPLATVTPRERCNATRLRSRRMQKRAKLIRLTLSLSVIIRTEAFLAARPSQSANQPRRFGHIKGNCRGSAVRHRLCETRQTLGREAASDGRMQQRSVGENHLPEHDSRRMQHDGRRGSEYSPARHPRTATRTRPVFIFLSDSHQARRPLCPGALRFAGLNQTSYCGIDYFLSTPSVEIAKPPSVVVPRRGPGMITLSVRDKAGARAATGATGICRLPYRTRCRASRRLGHRI